MVEPEPIRRGERLALAALMLVVALLYLPTLSYGALAWDDPVWLEDPVIGLPWPAAATEAFTTLRDRTWSPLLRLTFKALAPGGPGLLHTTQLVLLLTSLPLLTLTLRALGADRTTRLGAVALWALHPTRVESAAWITGLKDLLSLDLLLAGSLLLLRGHTAGGTAAWAAAMLVKAAVAPGIVALALLDGALRTEPRSALRRYGTAALMAALCMGVARWSWYQGDVPAPAWEGGRLGFMLSVLDGFLARAALIGPSCAAYADPTPAPALRLLLAAPLVLAGWLGRTRPAAIVLLASAIPLAPYLGVVPMAFWASDRHLLLPGIGLAALLAAGAAALGRAGPVAIVALSLLLGARTAARVPAWASDEALWAADEACPGDQWARGFNGGMAAAQAGRFEEAIVRFDRALQLRPHDGPLLARRLLAGLALRWDPQAQVIAARLTPTPPDARTWTAIAVALIDRGDLPLAGLAVGQALHVGGDRPETLLTAARVALGEGREDDVRTHVRRAAQVLGRDPTELEAMLRAQGL
jgi:Flp pilus assembly protein TadD